MTKYEMNEATIQLFRDQFANLHDGIIQRIKIDTSGVSTHVDMTISTCLLKPKGKSRIHLHLVFENVHTLVVKAFPEYSLNVIFAARYAYSTQSKSIVFDFAHSGSSQPSKFEEYGDGQSELLIKAGKCTWRVANNID